MTLRSVAATFPRSLARVLAAALVLLAGLALVPHRSAAETPLPALTGRVVDGAGVLSAEAEMRIEGKLKVLEEQSGIQLVVATVGSLGGEEIEPYANRLFRAWKLGEQKRNNGVLVLVAPNERRARIEVGYGLEGTLTDATSKLILANAMTPRLKAQDYAGGIERGVDDVIAVLSTDKTEWEKRPDLKPQKAEGGGGLSIVTIIVVIIILFAIFSSFGRSRRGRRGGMIVIPTGSTGADWGSPGGGFSSGGGSSGDSGFSGGGGSSGGGGASDSW